MRAVVKVGTFEEEDSVHLSNAQDASLYLAMWPGNRYIIHYFFWKDK